MGEATLYGGQAVIEGVMMRGPDRMAVAVRKADGQIAIHSQEIRSVLQRYPFLRLPILRGAVALFETLSMGITALLYSANQAAPEGEELTRGQMTLTSVIGIGFALLVFVALPTWGVHLLRAYISSTMWVNVLEGIVRLGLFLGYLQLISLMQDIQRVFQYHGAEHKVINAFEAGADLTVANARTFSREHKRCGTSFLLYVVVISIVVFAFLGLPNIWLRILSRLALMPVVAGVAYEFIRFLGRHDGQLIQWISRPGMWLQGFTTREPNDDQLEVAIASFETARGFGIPG